jgi:hypothetical protein
LKTIREREQCLRNEQSIGGTERRWSWNEICRAIVALYSKRNAEKLNYFNICDVNEETETKGGIGVNTCLRIDEN